MDALFVSGGLRTRERGEHRIDDQAKKRLAINGRQYADQNDRVCKWCECVSASLTQRAKEKEKTEEESR